MKQFLVMLLPLKTLSKLKMKILDKRYSNNTIMSLMVVGINCGTQIISEQSNTRANLTTEINTQSSNTRANTSAEATITNDLTQR